MPKRTLIIVGILALVVVIYVVNGSKGDKNGNDGTPQPTANQCRVAVTADVLNVRKAADPKAEVVGKYKQGAQVNADKKVTNGFRQVGADRWVAAQFVKPVQGSDC